MSRVEENIMILKKMNKMTELHQNQSYKEAVAFQLTAITMVLEDISKSLAICADKLESNDKI